MTNYQPHNRFLLRSALLTTKEIKNTHSSEGIPKLALKALELGAPQFYKKLLGDKKKDLSPTLFRYLLRMATRVPSYSIFSGISLGKIGEATKLELDSRENATITFSSDFVNAVDEYFKLTPDFVLKTACSVCCNPTLIKQGSLIKYFALHRDSRGNLQYSVRKIPTSKGLKNVMGLAKGNISARLLCEKLPEEYIKKLLHLQILIPCFENIKNKNLEKKIKLKNLNKEKSPASTVAHLYRPAKNCVLDKRTAGDIIKGAENFLALTSHQTAKQKARSDFAHFSRLFCEKYGRREIPLLEAALWFCSPQITQRLQDVRAMTPFDRELLKICIEHNAYKTGLLSLTDEDFQALKKADEACFERGVDMPDTISISAQLLDDGNIYYNHILGPPMARHLARFAAKDTEIYETVKEMVELENSFYQDQILAEISCPPGSVALGNVGAKEQFYKYSIPISEIGRPEGPQALSLDDLRVSFWDSKLRIRSASLNKEVIPVLNSLYSAQLDTNPVYSFLYQILTQNSFNTLSWNWGILSDFDFYPRLSYRNFIFSPAIWRLRQKEIVSMRKKVATLEQWRQMFSKRNIPDQIALQEADRILVFDLRIDAHLVAFIDGLKTTEDNMLYEPLQNPFKNKPLATSSPDGHVFSDIILPCFKRNATPRKNSLNNFHLHKPFLEVPFSKRNKGFDQGCVYVKAYGQPDDLLAYLAKRLPQLVNVLKKKKLIKNWFFINYVDEGPHLRLRFFSPSRKLPVDLLQVVDKELKKCLESGIFQKCLYDNYEPEIERYGGLEGIEVFEKIFSVDSDYILRWHHALFSSSQNRNHDRLYFTLISLDKIFDDLALTVQERIEFLKIKPNYPIDLSSMTEEFRLFRSFRDSLVFQSKNQSPFKIAIEHLLGARSQEFKPHFKKIRALMNEGKMGVGMKGLVNSLVHMHINRLNYLTATEEEMIKYFLIKLYFARNSTQENRSPCL